MSKQNYKVEFTSKNEEDEKFTLTFSVERTKHTAIITDPDVYEHKTDKFCCLVEDKTGQNITRRFRAESLTNWLAFQVEIHIVGEQVHCHVIERVVTFLVQNSDLQPTKE